MIPANKIIVALDVSDEKKLHDLMDSLKGHEVWTKIGMEVFYALGPKVIHEAKDRGFKVFLDLKLHDIPNTVGKGIASLCKLPIDMVNVHAAGGSEMMKRAAEAVKASGHSPLLIAVTQLTSTTTEQMNREQKIMGDVKDSVAHFAKLAQDSGCDGVVSSPLEVEAIKAFCGKRFYTVTPGIRPADSAANDQKRITTPMDALRLGTDYMVIGRPITEAANPREALEQILKGQ
ncbi:orotidine-5'-phosphate decarboxylase [Peredibacter starrii]|uniref:Orotidine 5'-phosphate decarboxylase n=1 Tax=Peredibacter starrii TaxID=28202 RepID=A0AAX4HSR9_9BACT|nr:orotidine-5'-phosphate decarboxylase [Peredibacter starrii]WPU66277.1 orotidine-5'-phosphate decarboxylase [Peredibacter starrii]